MKKKISILGLVLILVLSFTGCGQADTTGYDENQMAQYSEALIQNFSSMSEDDFASFQSMSELQLDLTLLQAGFPITGEDFLSMINAWNAGIEECGAFIGVDGFEMEVTNDGATMEADAEYADRDATIQISFDDEMNMETLTVSAQYSTGEILQKAGLNTILGMGTVFVVLIFLSFVIWLLKFIPVLEKKFRKNNTVEETAAPAPAPAAPAEPVEEEIPAEDETDDTELAAVIAAAVAEYEGTSTDGFVVRSIRRRKSNKWN